MHSLTSRQHNLLYFLLTAERPMGAAQVGQEIGLTARQVNYNLKAVKSWLRQHQSVLQVTQGVGMQVLGSLDDKQELLDNLLSEASFQLVLLAAERQQLLAFDLLTTTEPLILYQMQRRVQVSRTTISKDLDMIEKWLEPFDVRLDRRPNYGCSLIGSELAQRQALTALLWGDVPFGAPIITMTYTRGLIFSLTKDANHLPIIALVNQLLSQWATQSALENVVFAESQLGWRFTDNAVIHLALALTIQSQRIQNKQLVLCDTNELAWLREQSVWPISELVYIRLGMAHDATLYEHEVAVIAMHLLASPRNDQWSQLLDLDDKFKVLIDKIMLDVAKAYQLPELEHDSALRNGLAADLIPACMRQRFGLWAPPLKYVETLSAKYAFELNIAHQLADHVTTLTGRTLPQHDIHQLALLLRAASIRKRPARLQHVLVVCPSGMATTQLLVARLKARFPRLGTLEALSLRELNPEKIESAQLIITTVPLSIPNSNPVEVIQVHPLLSPQDITNLRHWLG